MESWDRRGLDDDPFTYLEENVARLEGETRAAAGDYFGASPDDFAMFPKKRGSLSHPAKV